MVVVRISRPTVATTTDRGMKPMAYGFVARPDTAPAYPIEVANVSGRGKYRILVAGDGDAGAVFKVYVDGVATPADSAGSDAPAVIEGSFNSSVRIAVEGSGLHASFVYEVWIEQDYVIGVTIS